jgi:hypothetical protein
MIMKAKIVDENNIGNRMYIVKIHLMPENATDSNSIRNTEKGEADENERVTVEGFLNFSLSQNNYSPVDYMGQQGEIFIIEAYKN